MRRILPLVLALYVCAPASRAAGPALLPDTPADLGVEIPTAESVNHAIGLLDAFFASPDPDFQSLTPLFSLLSGCRNSPESKAQVARLGAAFRGRAGSLASSVLPHGASHGLAHQKKIFLLMHPLILPYLNQADYDFVKREFLQIPRERFQHLEELIQRTDASWRWNADLKEDAADVPAEEPPLEDSSLRGVVPTGFRSAALARLPQTLAPSDGEPPRRKRADDKVKELAPRAPDADSVKEDPEAAADAAVWLYHRFQRLRMKKVALPYGLPERVQSLLFPRRPVESREDRLMLHLLLRAEFILREHIQSPCSRWPMVLLLVDALRLDGEQPALVRHFDWDHARIFQRLSAPGKRILRAVYHEWRGGVRQVQDKWVAEQSEAIQRARLDLHTSAEREPSDEDLESAPRIAKLFPLVRDVYEGRGNTELTDALWREARLLFPDRVVLVQEAASLPQILSMGDERARAIAAWFIASAHLRAAKNFAYFERHLTRAELDAFYASPFTPRSRELARDAFMTLSERRLERRELPFSSWVR